MQTKNTKDSFLHMREAALADIGELAGPVTHEVNNFLNTLTLHIAIWQQTSPQALAPDLQLIRQKITHVVKVLNHFQQRRLPVGLETVLVDLNAAMRQAIKDVAETAIEVSIIEEMEQTPLWVLGYEADVRRLCRYLLANAYRSVGPHGPPVIVRSGHSGGQIFLEVEDAGPNVPADQLINVFEPGNDQRPGMCCLELAACMSIVQRLRGKVQASARPAGGLIISVRLPLDDKLTKQAQGKSRAVNSEN